jgi:hypothetical protein
VSYAVTTNVSVEKTRAEIESMLQKRGATRTAFATEPSRSIVMFVINGVGVRFELPMPAKDEKRFTEVRRGRSFYTTPRPAEAAYAEWEQACRSLWRALFLCIKAKLEACESHITTFEAEFLAHIVTPSGKTFGEIAIPQICQMRDTGKQPQLQIGWNGE